MAANPDLKVGDRVCISGNKSGVIAFLGPTKFATGDWAGVCLDEPVGKNDGSVDGVAYFECKAMHGIFSRPSRLSKQQSPEVAGVQKSRIPEVAKKPLASSVRSLRRSESPSAYSSSKDTTEVSPTGSTTSLASSCAAGGPLRIGDRVIVGSQIGGTKTGTLRYLGPADFAQGEWAGIELDMAVGKNDGQVGEKRYFKCAENHGLFIPVHKVTRSPKNRMQKISLTSPVKLCRQKSDVSDLSMVSATTSSTSPLKAARTRVSVASITAPERLRASVKEKELKIEQLTKERDLERAEVAKAAMQTDQAETQLLSLKKEFMSYRVDAERQICDLKQQLLELQGQFTETRDALLHEQSKNEDLVFKMDEEQIMRNEAGTDDLMQRIRDLECALEVARCSKSQDTDQLKQQIQHLEEQLAIESKISLSLKKGTEQLDALTLEFEGQRQQLAQAEAQSQEARRQLLEKEQELQLAKQQCSIGQTELQELVQRTQLEADSKLSLEQKRSAALQLQLDTELEKVAALEDEVAQKERHRVELQQQIKIDEQQIDSLRNIIQEHAEEIKQSKAALIQHRMDMASKDMELFDQNKKCQDQSDQVNQLTSQLQRTESQLKEAQKSLLSMQKASLEQVDELKSRLDKSGQELHKRFQEQGDQLKHTMERLEAKETSLEDLKKQKQLLDRQLNDLTVKCSESEQRIAALGTLNQNLEEEIGRLRESSKTSSDEVKRLSGSLNVKDLEAESLRHDLNSLSEQLQKLKLVLCQLENESVAKQEQTTKQCQKQLTNLEDRLRKAEAARDKAEKSRDEAIQAQADRMRALQEEHQATLAVLKDDQSCKEAESQGLRLKVDQLNAQIVDSNTMINELQQKLDCHREQVERLQAERDGLLKADGSLQSTRLELQQCQTQLSETDARLALTEVEAQRLRQRLNDLEARNAELENSLAEQRETGSSSSEQLAKCIKDLEDKEVFIKKFKEEMQQYELSNHKLQEQLKESAQGSADLLRQLQEARELLRTEAQSHVQVIAQRESETSEAQKRLQEQLDALREEVAQKQADADKAEHKLDLERSRCQRLDQQLKDSSSRLIDLEQLLEQMKRNHEEEMGDMVDVVNDLKVKEEELIRLQQSLDLGSAEIVRLNLDLQTWQNKYDEDTQTLREQMEREVKSLKGQLEEGKAQMTYLKDAMGTAKVEHDLQADKWSQEKCFLLQSNQLQIDQQESVISQLREDLANKDTLLELTKEELAAKVEQVEGLELDLEIKEASFNNSFKESEVSHKDEVEILVTKVETANRELSDLNETLARCRADHTARLDQLLEERKVQVNALQDQVSDKERKILDLEAAKVQLQNELESVQSVADSDSKLKEAKWQQLLAENEELRDLKRELDSLVRKLQADQAQATHLNEELSVRIVEKERQVKEFTSQVQSMKITYEKTQKELSERLERSCQDVGTVQDVQRALERERARVDELQVALGDAESERDSLLKKVQDYEQLKQQMAQLEETNAVIVKNLEDLKMKHSFALKEFDNERSELNEVVMQSRTVLQNKLEDFKSQKQQYEQLALENQQLNMYKRNVLMLEQEKRELEARLLTQRAPSVSSNGGNDDLRIHVDFLNSIIVDMQRKNDQLNCKLQLLESAGVLDVIDVDDMLMLNKVDTSKAAPRLFCDICDQFDIHDTEDCPTQAMPAQVSGCAPHSIEEDGFAHTKSKGIRNAHREYCESCEVFGHDTANCSVAETF